MLITSTTLLALLILAAAYFIDRSENVYLKNSQRLTEIRDSLDRARSTTSLIRDLAIAHLGLNNIEIQTNLYQLERNLGVWAHHLKSHESGQCTINSLANKVAYLEDSVNRKINTSIHTLKKIAISSRPVSVGMSQMQQDSLAILTKISSNGKY